MIFARRTVFEEILAAPRPAPRLLVFVKAEPPVKNPGSRGGVGFWDAKGVWQYGERPLPGTSVSDKLSHMETHREIHREAGESDANFGERAAIEAKKLCQYRIGSVESSSGWLCGICQSMTSISDATAKVSSYSGGCQNCNGKLADPVALAVDKAKDAAAPVTDLVFTNLEERPVKLAPRRYVSGEGDPGADVEVLPGATIYSGTTPFIYRGMKGKVLVVEDPSTGKRQGVRHFGLTAQAQDLGDFTPDAPRPPKESYEVPEQNFYRLKEKVEKLNKRAKRLKLPPIVLTEIGEPFFKDMRITIRGEDESVERKVKVKCHRVKIEGELPRLGDWRFIAAVQHLSEEGGTFNLIHPILGVELADLPAKYKEVGNVCDHCKSARRRESTFLLQNEKTGEWKQVGRSCLADFSGGQGGPEHLGSLAEFLADVRSALEDIEGWDEGQGRRGKVHLGLDEYLPIVAACVRARGWVPRSKADAKSMATADLAWIVAFPPEHPDKHLSEILASVAVSDADRKTATDAQDWIVDQKMGKDENAFSDYEYNVYAAVKSGVASDRTMGIVASAISAFQRSQAQARDNAAAGETSKHFGEIGKRAEFVLTLTNVIAREGDYGMSYIHKFVDQEGNQATWFGSNPIAGLMATRWVDARQAKWNDINREVRDRHPGARDDNWLSLLTPEEEAERQARMEQVTADAGAGPEYVKDNVGRWTLADDGIGKTFHVKGTPKKHDSFRGIAQTTLGRVDPIAIVPAGWAIPPKPAKKARAPRAKKEPAVSGCTRCGRPTSECQSAASCDAAIAAKKQGG